MIDLSLLRSLVIEKRSYSRKPWRAVTPSGHPLGAGQEVCATVTFDHPMLGSIKVNEPLMGRTKRECVERLEAAIRELEAEPETMLEAAAMAREGAHT